MTERRLRQANLIGPAGYISMEDGAAPGFVQRAVATAAERLSVVEMGGASVDSSDSRVTEAAVRGFWQAYRRHMGMMSIAQQLAIAELNARYAQAIDDGALETWPDFFTEDGRYRITTAENFERGLPLGLIHATSRAMLRDRVRSLREANVYEAQRYRHLIGTPLVESGEGGALTAQTGFMVARIMASGETTLFATGRYHDRIVAAVGGKLLFAEKLVILDSRLIDTLLALPL